MLAQPYERFAEPTQLDAVLTMAGLDYPEMDYLNEINETKDFLQIACLIERGFAATEPNQSHVPVWQSTSNEAWC